MHRQTDERERQGGREREKENVLFAGSLPKWLQLLGLGQVVARSQEYHPVSLVSGRGLRLGPSSAAFSRPGAGNCISTKYQGVELAC